MRLFASLSLLIIFGQVPPPIANVPSWGDIIQGGALAILGYHLLRGLPQMMENNNKTQVMVVDKLQEIAKGERTAFEKRVVRIEDALEKTCRYRRHDDPEPLECPVTISPSKDH